MLYRHHVSCFIVYWLCCTSGNIMKPSIYLKGIDELERKCNNILKELSKEKRLIVLSAVRYIRDGIKENIKSQFKVRSGNLLKSPYAVAYPEKTDSPVIGFAGVRPRRAPHAHLLEYGHGGPHPAGPHEFVRPAIDDRKGRALDMVEAKLKKTIEGAV